MKPLILILLLCASTFGYTQAEMSSPEAIASGLKSSDAKLQAKLASFLSLKNVSPDQDFKQCDIRLDDVRLDQQGDTSVLQVKCGFNLNIVALRRSQPLSQTLDSRYFYAAYDRTKVEFVSLVRHPIKEIAIRNAATVSGNVYESYCLALRLVNGKLQVVFSSLENGVEPRIGGVSRNQESSFSFKPATEAESGEIIQAATIGRGKHSYRIERSFAWSDDWEAFIEDGVARVQLNSGEKTDQQQSLSH